MLGGVERPLGGRGVTVSSTKAAKAALVTSVAVIQNSLTVTVRTGPSSGWKSSEPMRKVPPGMWATTPGSAPAPPAAASTRARAATSA
jgi:hypothetical protein